MSCLHALFLIVGVLPVVTIGALHCWRDTSTRTTEALLAGARGIWKADLEWLGAPSWPTPEFSNGLQPEEAAKVGNAGRSWDGITVHHTVVEVSLSRLERSHRSRGMGGLAYHLLIPRHIDCDGCVIASRRWLTQEPVPQTSDPSINEQTIGIAVVGDSNAAPPSAAQLRALERTIAALQGRFKNIGPEMVRGHGEVAASDCPGSFLLEWTRAFRSRSGDAGTVARKSSDPATWNVGVTAPVEHSQVAVPPIPVPGAMQRLYARGYRNLVAGNLRTARIDFLAFLRNGSADHLSDNAQYWIASASLREGQYARALDEFKAVARLFPAGNKVPESLMKIAECSTVLGREDLALEALHELVSRYPDTPAAIVAADRLVTGVGVSAGLSIGRD